MTNKEYQLAVKRTLNEDGNNLANIALGIAGEGGEIADYVKKCLFQGHQYNADILQEELGDLLWYIANLCNMCGFELSEVMKANIEKLIQRYPDGFDIERSVKRD